MENDANKPIEQEIATSLDGRDITRPWVDRLAVNMPDDSVLLERGGGDYQLYREVLRDDHVKAAVEQRRRAVVARPWEVRPGGKRAIDRAAADFLRENIDAVGWDTVCDKMLAGVFYGYAPGECMWAADGRFWRMAGVKVRDRRRFGFDGENRLRMKTVQQPLGELMPERKFWVFATGADHDDAPYGLGLAHWLYWPVWFKRHGHRFWALYLEKYGMPAGKGTYRKGATLAERSDLLNAIRALRHDSAIVVPEGTVVELLEASHGGTSDYAAFVAAMNAAILVASIGQTASTQGTPGRLGNDDTQNSVRLDIVRADADLLSASFNAGPAKWLTEWNFPGAAVPGVWRIIEEPEDLKSRSERDGNIYRMGYRPTPRYIEETYGGEWERVQSGIRDQESGIRGQEGQGALAGANFAAPQETPAIAQAARLAADCDPLIGDWIATLEAMLAAADSLEEFQAMVLAAWPKLDAGALQTRLAAGLTAAHLAGRLEIQESGIRDQESGGGAHAG